MAKRIRVTAEGVTEQEVEASGQEQAVETATLDIINGLLGDSSTQVVEVVQVLVANRLLEFGIRHLSPKEAAALKRKRLRVVPGGKMVPSADADSVLRALALHECVCRNEGTADNPSWVPMWPSLDDVTGTKDKPGLMDNRTEAANELRSQLWEEIYRINSEINPVFLEAYDLAMQEAAKQVTNSI